MTIKEERVLGDNSGLTKGKIETKMKQLSLCFQQKSRHKTQEFPLLTRGPHQDVEKVWMKKLLSRPPPEVRPMGLGPQGLGAWRLVMSPELAMVWAMFQ